jgi:hypothetical protein
MSNTNAPPVMKTRELFVTVRMFDGSSFRGFIYLQDDERLQDLLNDARSFIPVRIRSDKGDMAILSKRYIVSIDEISDSTDKPFAFAN